MLVKYPSELLHTKSVSAIDNLSESEIRDIVSRMRKEAWQVGGFAISAIQIGEPYTILGFFSFKRNEYIWIIDPEIISTNGSSVMKEGCLSIPGYFWNIKRPAKATISYTDLDGTPRVRTFTEVIARAIFHEMDHFDGILIPDFMNSDQLNLFNQHYKESSHIDEYDAPELDAN